MILIDEHGAEKPAGEIRLGQSVYTRHEDSLEWGYYPVSFVRIEERPVFRAVIGDKLLRATGDHRIWLGGKWVRMRDIGIAEDVREIVQITVEDAHTYVSNGILSHNIKPEQL